jgi:hypothetical protein
VIFIMGRYIGSLNPSLENGFITCFDVNIGPIERLTGKKKNRVSLG